MQRMSRRKAERIERVRAGVHGVLDRERPGARGFRLQPLIEEGADEAGCGHTRDRSECPSAIYGEKSEHERIPEHPVPEAADAAKYTANRRDAHGAVDADAQRLIPEAQPLETGFKSRHGRTLLGCRRLPLEPFQRYCAERAPNHRKPGPRRRPRRLVSLPARRTTSGSGSGRAAPPYGQTRPRRPEAQAARSPHGDAAEFVRIDRKSTRLNSSHL